MWRLFRNKPKLVAEVCSHVCFCVCVWQAETESHVVPAGVCNGASIICNNFNQLPPPLWLFLPFVPSLSFLPRVKLAPLKDYKLCPITICFLCLCRYVCVCVCVHASVYIPVLLVPLPDASRRSQPKHVSFWETKTKTEASREGTPGIPACECMCVCVCACVHPAGWFAMRQGQMVTPGKAGWACLPASLWVMSASFSA